MTIFRLILAFIIIYLCASTLFEKSCCKNTNTEIFGHRGLRGSFPENSLIGFKESIKSGINKLEFDVVITADSVLIINHDTKINSNICNSNNYNCISNITYDAIKAIDCGIKVDKQFPKQKKIKTFIPTLENTLKSIESDSENENVIYYVEIKSPKLYFGSNIPSCNLLVSKLYEILVKYNLLNRVVIQSFDIEILQNVRKISSDIRTCLLIGNIFPISWNVNLLGYTPDYYAVYHRFITKKMVEKVHQHNMKIIAWTVNDSYSAIGLVCIGVDEIMSDYPLKLISKIQKK